MRYIKVLLEYDGTNYHGWQSQKSGRTIQDILKARVREITGEDGRLTGASRTDAGVHALAQVAVFGTESLLSVEVLMRALNAKLPPDIRVLDVEETGENFHPRYRAIKKSYFYILSEDRLLSAFLQRHVWRVGTKLDTDGMEKAASLIVGEHDFSSFRASGCGSRHPLRTVYTTDITRLAELSFMTAAIKGSFIKIRIEANAFLRHMVRNIVGTLVEVGRGKMSIETFEHVLKSCDRTKAGPTAPAHALFLEKLFYPE
jgi:tRNA pseudouridine38-40 synthase